MNEKKNEDLLKNVPDEIIDFFRQYFAGDNSDPEVRLRAELLAKTLIRMMLQLYTFGIDNEYQPVFIVTNYVKKSQSAFLYSFALRHLRRPVLT